MPKRSPKLNPLDQMWGKGKDAACANVQQASIEVRVERFIEYYQGLSPAERLDKAAMLSPDYWLYGA